MRGHIGFKLSKIRACLNEPADYFFRYVKLLLNFEEMSTAAAPYYIVDNSPDARQVELSANVPNPIAAAFETSPQKKFGKKSIRLQDGVQATVIAAPGKDFSLTRPGVVEFWLRASATTAVNKAKILGTDGWGFYLSTAEDPNNRVIEFVVFERAVRVTVAGTNYKILTQQSTYAGYYEYLLSDEAPQFNTAETSAWWGDESAAQNFAAAYANYLIANSLSPSENVKFAWDIVTVTNTYGSTYRQLKYYYVNSSLNVVSGTKNLAILQAAGTEYEYWEPLEAQYFARTSGVNDYPGVENGEVRYRVSNTFSPRPAPLAAESWIYVVFARYSNTTYARFAINGAPYGPTLNAGATFSDYNTPLTIGHADSNSGAYVDDVRITINSSRDYPTGPAMPSCPFPIEGPTPDPLFNHVELLLHLDGDYWNPVVLTDSSTRNRPVNEVGFVRQYPAGYGKFGGAVFFWPNYGGYLSIPYDAAWDFDTGPFTLEFWIVLNTQSVGAKIIGTAGWGIFVVQPEPPPTEMTFSDLRLEMRTYDSNGDVIYSADCGPISVGPWTYVFITNTEVCVGTVPGAPPQFCASGKNFNPTAFFTPLTIGGSGSGNVSLTAYVDEVRITRAARPRPAVVPATAFLDNGPPPST